MNVDLNPQTATGSTFAGWSTVSGSDCESLGAHGGVGSDTCEILLEGDTVVQATFDVKPAPCLVPGLRGKTFVGAKRDLKSNNCAAGTITYAFSSKVRKGRVISQNPLAHWHNKPGSKVNLVLSYGTPRPCVVPNLKGKTLPTAKQSIRSHACSVGRVKHVLSRKVKKGHVISQTPRPGGRLKYRAAVNVLVSGLPPDWRASDSPSPGLHGGQ